MTNDQRLEVGLFRYGLIHPLLNGNLTKGELTALRKEILLKEYDVPYSCRTQICERTLRKYMQWYRENKFEGLINSGRKDKGIVKAIPDDVLEKAFEFKGEVPQRSIREIIEMLELSEYINPGDVKNSTLSRIMSQNKGKLRITNAAPIKALRRFQKDHVNDYWQSDVKHCIYIPNPKNPKEYIKTYLICFLDDKSRRVSGKIYFAENTANVEDCFRKALIQMGVPCCFYTDNASYYKAKRLQLVCAELGSNLKYCKPYTPTSKGKVEKFNSYVDKSFESEAKKLGIKTIEELNEYFECWVSENYNNKIHSGIKMTPNEAHTAENTNIRRITPEEIKKVFMQRLQLKPDKTAIIKFNQNLYRVESILAKKKIELRFDKNDLTKIEVFYQGTQYKDAEIFAIKNNVWDGDPKKIHSETNYIPVTDPDEMKTSYLKLLQDKYNNKLTDKVNRINYSDLYPKGAEDSDV